MVMCVCDSATGTQGHSESETITDHLESLASDIERVSKNCYNLSLVRCQMSAMVPDIAYM